MTVSVYARHSSKCSKSRERGTGQFKRCKCPLWLRWGKDGKKSAKTRSWDIATKAARKLEQELELAANGIEPLKKPDHITIQSAVDLYLSDMNQRSLAKPTVDKARRMITRLRDYANAQGIILLKDVTARLLTEWRNTWTFKAKSSSPAVHWAVSKTFSKWAFRTDLIEVDPSAKLKSLPSEHNQVQPLTQGDMQRLLAATDNCEFSQEVAYRVKTIILLMRWSGLACMDAATLRRDALGDDNNLTRRRNKTNVEVFVPLPPAVAEMLRAQTNDHPDYFFWNPERLKKTSIVCEFSVLFRKVFDKAGVSHSKEEMLSHRFRHTFAVEMLLAGVPIERVSKLLGHKTTRTTEKFYSAWVKERQRKLEAEVKEAWKKMALPEPVFHVRGTVQ
jgi:site-specific recombinase XerD